LPCRPHSLTNDDEYQAEGLRRWRRRCGICDGEHCGAEFGAQRGGASRLTLRQPIVFQPDRGAGVGAIDGTARRIA